MLKVFLITLAIASASCAICKNPELVLNSYTTRDATIVSRIALIAEFSLECEEPKLEYGNLFAEVDGKITPLARIEEKKYQVSWTEDIKKVSSGNHVIRLFDEEGFANIRKAQRSGDDLQSVQSFLDINVNHPGTYKGPWVNSEIVAAVSSVLIAYFAFSAKSKILS